MTEKTTIKVLDRNTGRWRDGDGKFSSLKVPAPDKPKPKPRNKT